MPKFTSDKNNLFNYLYESSPKLLPNRKKISSEKFTVPDYCEWDKLLSINYNVSQLKLMAGHYKQRKSGKKNDLIQRMYNYLKFSFYAIKIQKIRRGYMIRYYNKLHGPGIFKRKECVNSTDFLSLNKIENISHNQFFSFKDEGFIYGFDAKSLYNLIKKNNIPTNPYNRNIINKDVIKTFNEFLNYGKILKKNTIININNSTGELSISKRIELNAHSIFQKIDSLGHVTDANWFNNLDKPRIVRLIRELIDIWNYRALLTPEIKNAICPPNGNPFSNINIHSFANQSLLTLKLECLKIFNNLISKSPDQNNQALGAFYVLGSLTIVNTSAANALPWLYESFNTAPGVNES